ncbi:MAG: Lar family restriction alleviation protein [Synergistaceae bacterium]|nr:Lar family restriction alleviation protein [Synergistaceae bacterium]
MAGRAQVQRFEQLCGAIRAAKAKKSALWAKLRQEIEGRQDKFICAAMTEQLMKLSTQLGNLVKQREAANIYAQTAQSEKAKAERELRALFETDVAQIELKPCPHCGGEAKLNWDEHSRAYVTCPQCGARSWSSFDPAKAAEAWNRRA